MNGAAACFAACLAQNGLLNGRMNGAAACFAAHLG